MPDLKPCAFCGTAPETLPDPVDGWTWIWCDNCLGNVGDHNPNKPDKSISWNRRTPPPATKALLDLLKISRPGISLGSQITKAFVDEWESSDESSNQDQP